MKNPLLRALVVGAAVLATYAAGVRAQADGLIVHELATTAGRLFSQNTATMKPVVTASGSIVFLGLTPEWRQRPHHHEQEQVIFVLSGTVDVLIDGSTHSLGPMQAAIPPSNVPHNMINNSGKPATVLEYQPVARQDWLGTPSAGSQKQSPQPLALTAGQIVNQDFSPTAGEWRVGADGGRSKSFAGQSIRVEVWELPTPNSSARLEARTAGARRFLYMIEGESRLVSTGTPRTIAHDSVVEMSDQTSIRVQPAGTGRTVFAVFDTLGK